MIFIWHNLFQSYISSCSCKNMQYEFVLLTWDCRMVCCCNVSLLLVLLLHSDSLLVIYEACVVYPPLDHYSDELSYSVRHMPSHSPLFTTIHIHIMNNSAWSFTPDSHARLLNVVNRRNKCDNLALWILYCSLLHWSSFHEDLYWLPNISQPSKRPWIRKKHFSH